MIQHLMYKWKFTRISAYATHTCFRQLSNAQHLLCTIQYILFSITAVCPTIIINVLQLFNSYLAQKLTGMWRICGKKENPCLGILK